MRGTFVVSQDHNAKNKGNPWTRTLLESTALALLKLGDAARGH